MFIFWLHFLFRSKAAILQYFKHDEHICYQGNMYANSNSAK
jgi:hypothetical protein